MNRNCSCDARFCTVLYGLFPWLCSYLKIRDRRHHRLPSTNVCGIHISFMCGGKQTEKCHFKSKPNETKPNQFYVISSVHSFPNFREKDRHFNGTGADEFSVRIEKLSVKIAVKLTDMHHQTKTKEISENIINIPHKYQITVSNNRKKNRQKTQCLHVKDEHHKTASFCTERIFNGQYEQSLREIIPYWEFKKKNWKETNYVE